MEIIIFKFQVVLLLGSYWKPVRMCCLVRSVSCCAYDARVAVLRLERLELIATVT